MISGRFNIFGGERKRNYEAIPDSERDEEQHISSHGQRTPKRLLYGIGAFGAVMLLGLFFMPSQPGKVSATLFSRQTKGDICKNPKYSTTTLKVAAEQTFMSLIKAKNQYKFEASDVVVVNDAFYTVCDSSWAIEKVSDTMTPFSPENVHISGPERDKRIHGKSSQYEAIVYDSEAHSFLLVREALLIKDTKKSREKGEEEEIKVRSKEDRDDKISDQEYRAIVEEVTLAKDGKTYKLGDVCVTEFIFDGKKKGFEGAVGLRDSHGELFLLALCEGNECAEDYKNHAPGNGIGVLMKKVPHSNRTIGDYKCAWETYRYLRLPKSAHFIDYSAISVSSTGRVAVASQEESQVWIGKMSHFIEAKDLREGQLGLADLGTFDPDKSEFVEDNENPSAVYNFPRDSTCEIIYCNVEGIHWMTDDLLVGVSDQMKSDGSQDFRCLEKDQSLHIFIIPHAK